MSGSAVEPAGRGRRFVAALESALAFQREAMGMWGDQLEQMLTMLVLMVPVQDDASDVTGGFWNQVCYAGIDLFGLYRTVLLRSPEAIPVALPNSSPAQAGRLQHLRLTYTAASFALKALRAVQVLLEMRAVQARGHCRALAVCFRIEVVKLALKVWLRTRMPFAFYVDEEAVEEVDPSRPPSGADPLAALRHEARQLSGEGFVGRRSGKTFRATGQLQNLHDDASPASFLTFASEVAFHSRPLVHLHLLRRMGRKSWAAWWGALVLDRLSIMLLAAGFRARPGSRAAALELAELRRRSTMTWWALARSPFFEKLLQRPAEAVNRLIKRIPILNVFNVVEVGLALQPFYFSTAAS